MMKKLILIFALCAPLSAQLINWGVKGGVPFNDAVKAAGTLNSNFHRWTLGPTFDLNLPAGLGVEFDILYRRTGYTTTASTFGANSFEFPLLAKYKFPGKLARLYVDGGFVFRSITDVPLLQDATSKGFAFGAGIQYNLKLIKISPELRYTHWGNEPFKGVDLGSARNQTEFLIGITF
jgi:opacity protein-like surface antigen